MGLMIFLEAGDSQTPLSGNGVIVAAVAIIVVSFILVKVLDLD